MSISINTNLSALSAQRNLSSASSSLSKNVSRLSSGLRITSGADDPAGLVLSEKMRAQIKGLSQAISNSQDAVNMTKTAEGGMEEIQRLLEGIRATAVHAANTAVVDNPQLQADQNEIKSVLDSINRIAQSTQWGSKQLLNGTSGTRANITAGNDVASANFTGTFANQQISSGPLTLTRTTAATQTTLQTDKTYATANTTVPAGNVVINGVTITSDGTSDTVQTMVDKINQQSANTGVVASIDTTGGTAAVKLQSLQYGSQFDINYFDSSGIFSTTPNPAPTTAGVDAVYSVEATVIGPTGVTTATSVFTGGKAPGDTGLKLTDADGNTINLSPAGNASATYSAATAVGTITSGNVRFQIGANSDQYVTFSMPDIRATELGSGAVSGKTLSNIDVTSQQGASDAIDIIDAAISQLSEIRGKLGSFQKNFLESTVRSLSTANENIMASESQIRDLDIATEMTNYTRNQVLQQSSIAILSQANQNPQQLMKLLQ